MPSKVNFSYNLRGKLPQLIITQVNYGRQSYKGFFYNPSVATQQCNKCDVSNVMSRVK